MNDPEVIRALQLHFEKTDIKSFLKDEFIEWYKWADNILNEKRLRNLQQKNEIKTVKNQIELWN